jgi:hypothetical protein
MAEHAVTETTPAGVAPLPPDEENEALLDAHKTFVITAVGAVLFCGAALAIIFGLGM